MPRCSIAIAQNDPAIALRAITAWPAAPGAQDRCGYPPMSQQKGEAPPRIVTRFPDKGGCIGRLWGAVIDDGQWRATQRSECPCQHGRHADVRFSQRAPSSGYAPPTVPRRFGSSEPFGRVPPPSLPDRDGAPRSGRPCGCGPMGAGRCRFGEAGTRPIAHHVCGRRHACRAAAGPPRSRPPARRRLRCPPPAPRCRHGRCRLRRNRSRWPRRF